jgi:hypothetical protein
MSPVAIDRNALSESQNRSPDLRISVRSVLLLLFELSIWRWMCQVVSIPSLEMPEVRSFIFKSSQLAMMRLPICPLPLPVPPVKISMHHRASAVVGGLPSLHNQRG